MSWLCIRGQSVGASASVPEYSGLISFRVDLQAAQGTLKSLLKHTIQKRRVLVLGIFMVQLSHLDMTTGKSTALTIQTSICPFLK